MKAANTSGVDGVSGATVTSVAFKRAVRECLAQAGAPAGMSAPPKAEKRRSEKVSTDVLVVGAGAAGFSAAIAAAEGGASVILIEKQDIVGGSTVTSAGIVYAAMNPQDQDKMVDYYMARAEGKADRARLRFFAEHSLGTIEFLEKIGGRWMMTVPAGTAPEPRARFSKHPDGTAMIGSALTIQWKSAPWILGDDPYRRAGPVPRDRQGRPDRRREGGIQTVDYTFNAKAVILAREVSTPARR